MFLRLCRMKGSFRSNLSDHTYMKALATSISRYYALTKPGIIYGNLVTVTAGFLLASKGYIDLALFVATLLGISLIIASGCVFNNYIDRDIDRLMERTKNRVLVHGLISHARALFFGTLLGVLGALVLWYFTNAVTLAVALAGLFFYIFPYSLWSKRHSIHGTIIGSVAGAVPPVVGYVAVSTMLDLGAVILFLTLSLWQMPHAFAIAMYRIDDYRKASIPVLPVAKGGRITKVHMLLYILAFILVTDLLFVFGYTGYLYFTVMTFAGFAWFLLALWGFRKTHDDKRWARRMFVTSILIIILFAVMVGLDVTTPAIIDMRSVWA